ncbi:MAG: hypothetical protein ACJ0BJ_05925 [Pirellulales bacterium]
MSMYGNQHDVDRVEALLEEVSGIDRVFNREKQTAIGIDHERSGDLVVLAEPGCWFTYYFWMDDARAPDYARTVDIHRKPGYDPVELFLDSGIRFPKAHIAKRLMQKKFGFRYLMDVIGLDATVVRGSHGRLADHGREETDSPVFVCSSRAIEADAVAVTGVKKQLLQLQFGV